MSTGIMAHELSKLTSNSDKIFDAKHKVNVDDHFNQFRIVELLRIVVICLCFLSFSCIVIALEIIHYSKYSMINYFIYRVSQKRLYGSVSEVPSMVHSIPSLLALSQLMQTTVKFRQQTLRRQSYLYTRDS